MNRAVTITRKIISACESLSVKEIEQAFEWLSDILNPLGFFIVHVDTYDNGGIDSLDDEVTINFTYKNTSESDIAIEELTLSCKPDKEPFMISAFSFSSDDESDRSFSLYVGGTSWKTKDDVQNSLQDWIEEIRSSAMYHELLSNAQNGSADWETF
jgi:hypothetical protein